MSRIRFVKGKIIKTTGGNYNMYSNGNIVTNAGGFINETAGNQIIYGVPEDPPRWKNPKIIEMQFLNESGKILKNENITKFGGIFATDFLYGKKLKIKFLTRDVEDGTKIEFKLKGNSKDDCQDFFQIDKLKWNLEINNNYCETDFFTLNTLWYSENFEFYNYKKHRTEIKDEDLNTFSVKGQLEFSFFELPENREDDLKPIAYLRNYEELIGLFNTDNSGQKALIDNYENKFINYNPEIFKISREFSGYLNYSENLTLNDIKARVETDAKKLWETAVKVVQEGDLDDRPLYWARNKMQVRLKRNALFANDIDFETSIVKKDSELDKIIQLFEEKSRNYTDIDFSKAGNKKKVLITGFDPFQLNPDPNFNTSMGVDSANTFNPSGIIALFLNKNQELLNQNIYIQTCIFPVRYEDFDNECVENVISKYFHDVDAIMTTSLNGGNNWFDVEADAISYRGGFHDNMCIGGQDYSQYDYNSTRFIPDINNQHNETTLPSTKIFGVNLSISINNLIVRFDISKLNSLKEGGGGNYLSNEIMFRATKIRGSSIKPVGHLHLANLGTITRVKEVIDVSEEIIKKIIY